MAKSPRLSRLGFVAWLIAPVVVVGILWTQMDRSLGKPNPKLMSHRPSAPGPQADAVPTSRAASLARVVVPPSPSAPPVPTRPDGGRLATLQVVGGGVPLVRELLVWLPPGYDDPANASRAYPVLYLQDGQNLFAGTEGSPVKWQAEATAAQLIDEGAIEPLIIVGIPHSGVSRISEYLTTPAITGPNAPTPRGDAYLEFVVSEVVPRVDRAFRTKATAGDRGIGGSSLGGLISLYAGLKRPDVFGKVLAESPSVRLQGADTWRTAFDGITTGPGAIYMGMGTNEMGGDAAVAEKNQQLVASLEALKAWLEERKIGGSITMVIEPGAAHNEEAWARRLPTALKTLFPPQR